jgi:hypothetical protein
MLNRNMAVSLSCAYVLLAVSILATYAATFFAGRASIDDLAKIQETVAKVWPLFIPATFVFGVLIYLCGMFFNKNNDYNRLQLGPSCFYAEAGIVVFSIIFLIINVLSYGHIDLRVPGGNLEMFTTQGWVALKASEAKDAVFGLLRWRLAEAFFVCTLAFGMALMGFVEASANKRLTATEEQKIK